jgi:cytochrome c oxidase subunit III
VHGLHILGGQVALGRTMDKAWQGVAVGKVRLSVELCATYWHFLLLVWLVLFALLLLTDPIEADCGVVSLICRIF